METIINLCNITHPNSNKQKKEIQIAMKLFTSLKENKAPRFLKSIRKIYLLIQSQLCQP